MFDDVDDMEEYRKKEGKKYHLGFRYPENDKNARDIELFLDGLEKICQTQTAQIITQSTYLARKILSRKNLKIEWVNIRKYGEILKSPNIDNVGKIEIFEREIRPTNRR